MPWKSNQPRWFVSCSRHVRPNWLSNFNMSLQMWMILVLWKTSYLVPVPKVQSYRLQLYLRIMFFFSRILKGAISKMVVSSTGTVLSSFPGHTEHSRLVRSRATSRNMLMILLCIMHQEGEQRGLTKAFSN